MKVYIEGDKKYANWFDCEVVERPKQSDLIVFTGGEDVTPTLYGQRPGKNTKFNRCRDMAETRLFQFGHLSGRKMLGICRGAQFLTVMSGGVLIQHITNHGSGLHTIEYFDKERGQITSTHHQMMYPHMIPRKDWRLLAWSTDISKTYHGEPNVRYKFERPFIEPEIVYYKKTKSLAIQGHPERMHEGTDLGRVRRILNMFIKDKL